MENNRKSMQAIFFSMFIIIVVGVFMHGMLRSNIKIITVKKLEKNMDSIKATTAKTECKIALSSLNNCTDIIVRADCPGGPLEFVMSGDTVGFAVNDNCKNVRVSRHPEGADVNE